MEKLNNNENIFIFSGQCLWIMEFFFVSLMEKPKVNYMKKLNQKLLLLLWKLYTLWQVRERQNRNLIKFEYC